MSEVLVRDRWYALIVAGPSGSGKSVVAEHIGRELSLPVIDADDFHSREAVELMKSGTPLADEYRENWAERIIGGMIAWRRRGESVIIACSCIRLRTRDRCHSVSRRSTPICPMTALNAGTCTRLSRRAPPVRMPGSQPCSRRAFSRGYQALCCGVCAAAISLPLRWHGSAFIPTA